jgi:opacity protein-like surface antigen
MRFLAVAGLAGVCLAASPLYAADLFESAPPPMDASGDQSELGSNWYIRGDVGYGEVDQATVVPQAGLFPQKSQAGFFDPVSGAYDALTYGGAPLTFNGAPIGDASNSAPAARGNNLTVGAATFDIGFGYRVNDWLRVEGTYNFFKGPGYSAQTQVTCPGQANAVDNYNQQVTTTQAGGVTTTTTSWVPAPVGYTYDWSSCNGYLHTTQYNNMGLVSAYADLGHWGMFTPYIGAGVGINANTLTGTLNYYNTSTGQAYAGPTVSGTAPGVWVVNSGYVNGSGNPVYVPLVSPNGKGPTMEIGAQNWYRSINSTKYSFAAQVAAGLGIKVSQSATLDLGYRATTTDVTGGVKGLMQSVNLGVRYNIN